MIYHDKYLTKQLLIEYNRAARREKRSAYIDESYLNALPNANYPVLLALYHMKDEIRTMVFFDEKGNYRLLDMSFERYNLIPIASTSENGIISILNEDVVRKSLPYGGEEWIEIKVKKPYRGRQSNFRRMVLNSYDETCAVCEQKGSLRAAHIKDKANGGSDEIENGICLCANHEIAFDQGLLKIKPDGTVYSLIQDKSITVQKMKLPIDKEKQPSKKLLLWKHENL